MSVWACACTRPPLPNEELGTPEPALAAEPTPEAEAEPAADPGPDPLPRGPVLNADSRSAHAAAQAKMLRRGEELPPLISVVEPAPSLPVVGRSDRPEAHADASAVELVAPEAEAVAVAVAEAEIEPPAEGRPAGGVELDAPAPAPMPGAFVPIIEAAPGEALASFHAALRRLERGEEPDGKVRVAMYGASGTAADLSVGYVRTYLQARFGDGGPGFVPLVPLSRWYRHNEVRVEASSGWRKEHAQISRGRQDGHYGLLGASFTATASRRWAEVRPKERSSSCEGLAHVDLYYLRQPGGGSFRVRVDGGSPQTVSTAADELGPGYHPMELPPGPHTLRIETIDDAEVRVFGVVLERPEPGVVVDVLGIDGTRGRNHLTWNEALWVDNLKRRAFDLYTLSYGTNESVDDDLSIPLYAEDLRAQLRRFARALPEASCLVLGPVDFPVLEGDQVLPRPLLRQIIEVQRQVAAEEGCGFWDGIAFMGGELSMPAWVDAEPPLARRDHLHFTRWGAARKGMALADALMHAFDAASLAGLE